MDYMTEQNPLAELKRIIAALEKYRVDIERALVYGRNSHTFTDICAQVISGQVDLHILDGAIIIAETAKYPQYTAYNVFIAAGKLQPILEAQRGYLIGEAKKRGAKRLTFAGRQGWSKVLKSEGWSKELVLMSKEVSYVEDKPTRESAEYQSSLGSGGQQEFRFDEADIQNGVQPVPRH